jgi:hypothetical protein
MKRSLVWLIVLFVALAVIPGAVQMRAARPLYRAGIVSFTAERQIVSSGEAVTLIWETRGAASVTLQWRREADRRGAMHKTTGLPASGRTTVQPEATTIYRLECETLAGGTCGTARTTVRVKPWLSKEASVPAKPGTE